MGECKAKPVDSYVTGDDNMLLAPKFTWPAVLADSSQGRVKASAF